MKNIAANVQKSPTWWRFFMKFGGLGACAAFMSPVQALPSFDQVRLAHSSSDAVLVSREGEALGRARRDFSSRRGAWVALSDTSPALAQAVLHAEDRRFESHAGVDWASVAAALMSQAGGGARGASSISMQLVALLDADAPRAGQRGLTDKAQQMAQALLLESRWSKTQILEAYLNRVDFRGELRGIGAASQSLFDKRADALDKEESALLAALLRAPNAAPERVAQRACAVLRHTRPVQPCEAAALARRVAQRLPARVGEPAHALAHAQQSTLLADTQRAAQVALNDQLLALAKQGATDGAVVVLDNASGEVLAYVGSSGKLASAPHVDAAAAMRQAGSTLKPFIYGRAIDRGLLQAASVLDDAPLSIQTDAGRYAPRNYDERYIGPVSVRKALGNSLNIPAVRALQLIGAEDAHSQLRLAGLKLPRSAEVYGEALALGAAEVSLLELTNAYRMLANGGVWRGLKFEAGAKLPPERRVLSSASSFVIGDILSDNAARAHTFGFDSVLALPFWAAAKTGTSKDMRDNWCVGYSARYTVGVWVGNASGAPMARVSGTSGAAPAWGDVMRHLHRSLPSAAPQPPAGLKRMAVQFQGERRQAFEASRHDWWLAAHAPQTSGIHTVALTRALEIPKITEPLNGSQIAWDPDIPKSAARIQLAHTGGVGLSWRVNGKLWPKPDVPIAALQPGDNRVSLHAGSGRRIDEVSVTLRGSAQASNALGGAFRGFGTKQSAFSNEPHPLSCPLGFESPPSLPLASSQLSPAASSLQKPTGKPPPGSSAACNTPRLPR
jgi:penicillin-binding protein 1C